jgi:hypothetical protein
MMRRFGWLLAACIAGMAHATPTIAPTIATTAAPLTMPAPSAYAIAGTEVIDVHAPELKRDYQLFIALPDSYGAATRRFPVVFVTDANYGFPVAYEIANRLHKHAQLEEAIVVGLSYAKGDSPVFSRRRDYTPTVPRAGSHARDASDRTPAFGEADAYGRFIADRVLPLVAARYRIDVNRKAFVGHSYGALLGAQLLLTRPQTFDYYILGSPSLWYDGGVMFERERDYARGHKDLPARVYVGIGGLETLAPGKKRSRADEAADMVADVREFDAALTSHRYPGLRTQVEVFAGEDHASVFPFLFTHGLRAWLKRAPE